MSNCLSQTEKGSYNIGTSLSWKVLAMSDYSIVYYKDIESRKIEWLCIRISRTERLPCSG
ncbi:MAG: hypothetical protein IJK34_06540 [Clostridia bacterium]|nr:hypothetical protein [Clostridia bacterium]